MKLIVTGATGFVATEVIRQILSNPTITSIIAVSRKPVLVPSNLSSDSDTSKFCSIVVKDYSNYPEDVKKEFAGAGACIWTVGITLLKSITYDSGELKRICHDSTIAGLEAMYEADTVKPFRFLYMSGYGSERDQTKRSHFQPEYPLIRGETENQVLAFATKQQGQVEVSVAKPAWIKGPGRVFLRTAIAAGGLFFPILSLEVSEIATAMLDQVVKGFEKDTLEHDDLVRIEDAAIKERNAV